VPELEDGDIFDVYASNSRFTGRAFYQARGGICGRILSFHQSSIDRDFFKKRLRNAEELRRKLFPGSTLYRWIHGESDGLPGLIIDRYDSALSIQTSCAFYQKHQPLLEEILLSWPGISFLSFSFRDSRSEAGETLESFQVELKGLKLGLSLSSTQKTGLFLDQRENWPLVEPFASGARVLDAFCYHGLWGLHAARAGASSVTCIDTSQAALDQAKENARLNELDQQCVFLREKVENHLQDSGLYDVIILDPPAFAKSRKQQRAAFALYENINVSALKKLAPGGMLISCSCSHFLDNTLFEEMLKRAARRAASQLQLLMMRGAAPDHPVLTAMPETAYLKCAVLRMT
jgi:23S rRNA (cytosine1962-C5)-methyltransferase